MVGPGAQWVAGCVGHRAGMDPRGKREILNLIFTIPKCLKYKVKGKDHNSQTQLYFYSILIGLYYSITGYMFRLLFESSSGPVFLDLCLEGLKMTRIGVETCSP